MFTNSLSSLITASNRTRLDHLAEQPIYILVKGVNPIRKDIGLGEYPPNGCRRNHIMGDPDKFSFSIIIRSRTQLSRACKALPELYPNATFTFQQEKQHAI